MYQVVSLGSFILLSFADPFQSENQQRLFLVSSLLILFFYFLSSLIAGLSFSFSLFHFFSLFLTLWFMNSVFICSHSATWASLVAQLVKNPPVMQETWVRSLGWEDPWRRERLSTPVFWPGEFHGLYSPWGLKESDITEWLSLSLSWTSWWSWNPN